MSLQLAGSAGGVFGRDVRPMAAANRLLLNTTNHERTPANVVANMRSPTIAIPSVGRVLMRVGSSAMIPRYARALVNWNGV